MRSGRQVGCDSTPSPPRHAARCHIRSPACLFSQAVSEPAARFGSTPLVMATLNGHTECVHYLLEEGADVEQRNKWATGGCW